MLNRFSIKQRMVLILGLIVILFGCMGFFANTGVNRVRDVAIDKTSHIMLEDQKAKIKVATHAMALSIGQSIKKIANTEKRVEIIRSAVDNIRFEEDQSGYFFVYENTTNIALPSKKELQGKDLKEVKDANGIYLVKGLRDVSK